MTLSDFIQRARQGQATPMIYFLGAGGWFVNQRPTPNPGRPIVPADALAKLKMERPAVHAQYLKGLAHAGLKVDQLPHLACDCSGYVAWVLGVPRDGHPELGGHLFTDSIHKDAMGEQHLFVPLQRAVPGALLVYPAPRTADKAPGHVGIVVEADANGRATRVLHCAPDNYLLTPADGQPRNAIAETDTAHFDDVPATRVVMWKAFA